MVYVMLTLYYITHWSHGIVYSYSLFFAGLSLFASYPYRFIQICIYQTERTTQHPEPVLLYLGLVWLDEANTMHKPQASILPPSSGEGCRVLKPNYMIYWIFCVSLSILNSLLMIYYLNDL